MAEPSAEAPRLSIVVPVLNEAEILAQTLADIFARDWSSMPLEVIVCDGGSSDDSPHIAHSFPCRVLTSEPGRARQMNLGAGAARGEVLLFLHADSRLPANFDPRQLATAAWGFFPLRLGGRGAGLRVIERAINLRTRLTRVAGGDQGLFFARTFFESLGGFPAIPLMEDIAISKTARRLQQPRVLGQPLYSSSRRWREQGLLRTVLLMWWLRFAYWLGADPVRLHEIYYPGRR
ncbi:MAG: TIGR04283 family arsenosugar biosynthesis glycosyltransferase [Gammaproteobacteria bacterium]|nr:TIGR04283 family arsenosugar biosynthesis glycosyltransferase [Gammaproteobacteria bacterium]